MSTKSEDYYKKWRNITAIFTGCGNIVGLTSDNKVIGGRGDDIKGGKGKTEDWEDIIAVAPGLNHTVGLKANGTVVAVGINKDGQCNVEEWRDIIASFAEQSHTIGLKADGTVVATGDNNKFGSCCSVGGWRDIGPVSKEQMVENEQKAKHWLEQGLCQYCGGDLEGLFSKKCKSCSKQKKPAMSIKFRKIMRFSLLALAGLSYALGFMFRLHDIEYNEILIGAVPILILVFFLLRKKETSY
jgi:alpha-tubulin suppressor-like RCC1 family protein